MFRIVGTCLLWYLSSAITNNIGKEILVNFRFPVTLTMVQFGLSSIFAYLYGSFIKKNLQPLNYQILTTTFPLSLSQILGHIFSSVALTYVTVSFSHTIKALSPLFTVLIYKLLFRIVFTKNVYLSLIILTTGVMLVCATNLKFQWVGFLCALASTFVFVIQNIFSKKLFNASAMMIENTVKIDKLNLLFYSGAMAFFLMIPIWWNSEAYKVILNGKLDLYLIILFCLNGLTHFTQAIMAFSVLSIVSPVTYSIASLVKRIFVIIMSIFWFSDTVNMLQGFGIAITFFGLYLYQLAEKEVDKNERKIVAYQGRKSNGSLPLFSTFISKQ